MKIPFAISEFCITGADISIEVADKILKHHITPMIPIRERLGVPIWPSDNSGYRPQAHELKRGRSGKSQHCFIDLGAVDWTTRKDNIQDLLKELRENSPYLRVTYYPNNGFIHCDYKDVANGKRRYYECKSPTSPWKFIENLPNTK